MDIDQKLLAEAINKAYQTSANAPKEIQMDKDTEIQSRTVVEQTFLEFLQLNGRTRQVNGNTVVYFEEQEGGSGAEFIAEAGDIPTYNPRGLVKKEADTKTIAAPLVISMKAQDGTNDFDLKEYLLREKYIEVNNLIDQTVLAGDTTQDTYSFNSVTTGVTTISNSDDPITEAAIKSAIRACVKAGGHPDCLVCGSDVGDQIDDLVSPYIRYNNVTEIALGHTVSTFKSPEGKFIPILVDENTPDGTLGVLDTSSIRVAYQKEPTFIQLAQTNLATNDAVYSWVTAYNKAKFKSRVITNIGDE